MHPFHIFGPAQYGFRYLLETGRSGMACMEAAELTNGISENAIRRMLPSICRVNHPVARIPPVDMGALEFQP